MKITEQHVNIIRMLSEGNRPTEIGVKLGKSSRTVEIHIAKLRAFYHATTVPHLVGIAFREKIID